eukprot:CFRG7184T1
MAEATANNMVEATTSAVLDPQHTDVKGSVSSQDDEIGESSYNTKNNEHLDTCVESKEEIAHSKVGTREGESVDVVNGKVKVSQIGEIADRHRNVESEDDNSITEDESADESETAPTVTEEEEEEDVSAYSDDSEILQEENDVNESECESGSDYDTDDSDANTHLRGTRRRVKSSMLEGQSEDSMSDQSEREDDDRVSDCEHSSEGEHDSNDDEGSVSEEESESDEDSASNTSDDENVSEGEESVGVDTRDVDSADEVEDDEEKKEEVIAQPFDVLRVGKFYHHDNRSFGGNGRGNGRLRKELYNDTEKTLSQKWEHDMFEEHERTMPPKRSEMRTMRQHEHQRQGGGVVYNNRGIHGNSKNRRRATPPHRDNYANVHNNGIRNNDNGADVLDTAAATTPASIGTTHKNKRKKKNNNSIARTAAASNTSHQPPTLDTEQHGTDANKNANGSEGLYSTPFGGTIRANRRQQGNRSTQMHAQTQGRTQPHTITHVAKQPQQEFTTPGENYEDRYAEEGEEQASEWKPQRYSEARPGLQTKINAKNSFCPTTPAIRPSLNTLQSEVSKTKSTFSDRNISTSTAISTNNKKISTTVQQTEAQAQVQAQAQAQAHEEQRQELPVQESPTQTRKQTQHSEPQTQTRTQQQQIKSQQTAIQQQRQQNAQRAAEEYAQQQVQQVQQQTEVDVQQQQTILLLQHQLEQQRYQQQQFTQQRLVQEMTRQHQHQQQILNQQRRVGESPASGTATSVGGDGSAIGSPGRSMLNANAAEYGNTYLPNMYFASQRFRDVSNQQNQYVPYSSAESNSLPWAQPKDLSTAQFMFAMQQNGMSNNYVPSGTDSLNGFNPISMSYGYPGNLPVNGGNITSTPTDAFSASQPPFIPSFAPQTLPFGMDGVVPGAGVGADGINGTYAPGNAQHFSAPNSSSRRPPQSQPRKVLTITPPPQSQQ